MAMARYSSTTEDRLELLENLEWALQDYRNNEMVAQFKTINFDPVLQLAYSLTIGLLPVKKFTNIIAL
ncbi:hypothetical protein AHAS_Ahas03G0228200 [Arachis hypogaea]